MRHYILKPYWPRRCRPPLFAQRFAVAGAVVSIAGPVREAIETDATGGVLQRNLRIVGRAGDAALDLHYVSRAIAMYRRATIAAAVFGIIRRAGWSPQWCSPSQYTPSVRRICEVRPYSAA